MPNQELERSPSRPELKIGRNYRHFSSGANRDRTGDLLLAKQVLDL
jgi:hypothetical protein